MSSVSNLASGLGDRAFLYDLSSIDGKGSSSRTAGPSEARNEIIKTHYELIPSGAMKRSGLVTFTSRPTVDFDSHGTNIEISALPRLEAASETLNQGNLSSTSQAQYGFLGHFALEASNEEKLERYRHSVKNKHAEVEAPIEADHGYFNGKFMSTLEMVGNLNVRPAHKDRGAQTYLPDVMDADFFEDGKTVVQLLNDMTDFKTFADDLLYSDYQISMEEAEFQMLMKNKYKPWDDLPKDILEYLEGAEYLEDIYGLPELHAARDRDGKDANIALPDKQKALDRLVLLKNHMATPTDS